jgi:hypothetical protein
LKIIVADQKVELNKKDQAIKGLENKLRTIEEENLQSRLAIGITRSAYERELRSLFAIGITRSAYERELQSLSSKGII